MRGRARNAVWKLVMQLLFFFFQAEDGIRDHCVTGVQTCALPICFAQLHVLNSEYSTIYGHHNFFTLQKLHMLLSSDSNLCQFVSKGIVGVT